jgi:hypothetical protein
VNDLVGQNCDFIEMELAVAMFSNDICGKSRKQLVPRGHAELDQTRYSKKRVGRNCEDLLQSVPALILPILDSDIGRHERTASKANNSRDPSHLPLTLMA